MKRNTPTTDERPAPLKLPTPLLGERDLLELAFKRPLLAEWVEGEAFAEADQVQAVATVLIGAIHQHLQRARIKYLFREHCSKGGREVAGLACRAPARVKYLTEIDLLVEINWTTWRAISREQRIALVDHELCHFGWDDDANEGEGKWVLIAHDVEEFSSIVSRWGLWTGDLVTFGQVVKKAQFELQLEPAGAQ